MPRKNRVRPNDFTDVELMDDDDTIDSKGNIVWNHAKNNISMTKLSQHLKLSTAYDNVELKRLREMPAIKEAFDTYAKKVQGVTGHWKPRRLVALIKEDAQSQRKLSKYTPNTQALTPLE